VKIWQAMTMSQLTVSTGKKNCRNLNLLSKPAQTLYTMACAAKNLGRECAEVLNWLLTALASCKRERMFFSFHCISFIPFSDYLIQTWESSWESKKQKG